MIGLTPICPYCNQFSELVTGKTIYPHRKDLYKLKFFLCEPCDAYVGCHGTSEQPLGRLANASLRKAKSAAHRAFDPIWKQKHMSRSKAYKWLSNVLGIEAKDCHIGMFDEDQCSRVEYAASQYLAQQERW